jgi:hypothetical protein
MANQPGTLTIRFEAGAEPIAGTIVADGEELAFTGWIQLASLIDRLRPTGGARGGTTAPSSPLRRSPGTGRSPAR